MSRLWIIGAGGHGCALAELADRVGSWDSITFLDDQRVRPALDIGHEIAGKTHLLNCSTGSGDSFLVGLGENRIRLELLRTMRSSCSISTLIAPEACVSPSCAIGPGSVVMPGAILQTGVTIGEGCILNSGCIVEHGVTLGDGVHVAPGARIGGDVTIGECSWIGIGASVVHGVSMSEDILVGAGGVVVESITQPGRYVGVPARRLN